MVWAFFCFPVLSAFASFVRSSLLVLVIAFSLALGWDSRWGTAMEVTASGSSSTGTVVRPYGLDRSGFVDWVFYNATNGEYVIGHGGGASAQHSNFLNRFCFCLANYTVVHTCGHSAGLFKGFCHGNYVCNLCLMI